MPKAPSIRWVSTQPNIPILLTRPIAQSRSFAQSLMAQGIPKDWIHVAPVIEIEPLKPHFDDQDNRPILVTSANAMFFENAQSFLSGKDIICVGEKTAEAASSLGGTPIWIGQNVKSARAYLETREAGPMLYLRGQHITYDFSAENADIESCITYKQSAQKMPDAIKRNMLGGTAHLLPLFSLRTAQLVSEELGGFGSHPVIAISESVAAFCVSKNASHVSISKIANGQGMIDEILKFDFDDPNEIGRNDEQLNTERF